MSKAASKSTRSKVEDDIDDLDDVVTDFKPSRPGTPGQSQTKTGANTTVPPNTATGPTMGIDDLEIGNDFARELAEGMAALMREIAAETAKQDGEDADGVPNTEEEKKREAELRKAWEQMLTHGVDGALDVQNEMDVRTSYSETKEDASGAPFQSSIHDAMKKLKIADDAEDDSKLPEDENEIFEKLMSHLGDSGAESEEELQGLLENMMSQLMSKDVLYEPLKELHSKFPAYLKDNAATLKAEDKQRFEAQQKIVTEIVEIFEDPTYSADNSEQGIKIVTLMNTMQGYGSPPPEIMGPLPPGLDLGADGLPKLPDGCSIQ